MSESREPVKPVSGPEGSKARATPAEPYSSPEEAALAVREAVTTAAALGFDEGVEYVLGILQDLHEVAVKLNVEQQIKHDRGAGAYARGISDLRH